MPIYNDTYVMLFFGMLKKLVSTWLVTDPNEAQSLQNDLLCGQGTYIMGIFLKNVLAAAQFDMVHFF